jgi:hypothetical protein
VPNRSGHPKLPPPRSSRTKIEFEPPTSFVNVIVVNENDLTSLNPFGVSLFNDPENCNSVPAGGSTAATQRNNHGKTTLTQHILSNGGQFRRIGPADRGPM